MYYLADNIFAQLQVVMSETSITKLLRSANLTYDTLLWRWWNDSTLMQVLHYKLLMQAEKVAETSIDFHFCLPEVWNIGLQIKRLELVHCSLSR